MKTIMNKVSAAIVLIGLMISPSCKKKDTTPTYTNGSMTVKFNYVFGMNLLPFQLNQQYVHPITGDTLTFTLFKFYVSNIKLKKDDGSWWAMPESYFLVDAKSSEASTLNVPDVPYGNYTAIQYTMGVDSARNVSGAQTGALSLQNGMFWDWNSGYIMLKAEGYSPQSVTNAFAFHLGGFTGTNNVVTTNNADFGKSITIGNGANATVTMQANPAKLWHTSPSVSVKSTIHAPAPEAVTMAKNFYNNISLVSATN
ncbi:MAG: hypothetical protein JST82_14885 [Bacteroidetes bacterium]|nr:hypothetical protein [Bacteroidota bacterium]